MKIPRLYAKLCILSLTAGIVLMFLGSVLTNVPIVIISGVFIGIATLIKFTLLRCPYCRFSGMPPQWKKTGTFYCIKCGKLIEYE